MCSRLMDAAILEHVDLIDIDNGGQPMCAINYSLVLHGLVQLVRDHHLRVAVQITRRLIKEVDFSIFFY